MAYDFDGCADRAPPRVTTDYRPDPRDLELLVTVLALAAIDRTPAPAATFTAAELFASAREQAGTEYPVADRDLSIVLPHCKFLQRLPGRRYRLR